MEIFEHLLTEWHQRGRDPVEGTMSGLSDLRNIADDIKTHISNADQWLAKVLQEHVPQVLAIVDKYENSPIVQALEAAVLPPEVEAQVAAIISTLAKQYPAPAAEAAPEAAPEGQPQG